MVANGVVVDIKTGKTVDGKPIVKEVVKDEKSSDKKTKK